MFKRGPREQEKRLIEASALYILIGGARNADVSRDGLPTLELGEYTIADGVLPEVAAPTSDHLAVLTPAAYAANVVVFEPEVGSKGAADVVGVDHRRILTASIPRRV